MKRAVIGRKFADIKLAKLGGNLIIIRKYRTKHETEKMSYLWNDIFKKTFGYGTSEILLVAMQE